MKKTNRFLTALLLFALAFACGALAEGQVLDMPSDLSVIEEEAFYGDASIGAVELPEGITQIRARAFANSSLSSINLPDSLTFIDSTAFDGPDEVTVTANAGSYAHRWAMENGYIHSPVTDFQFEEYDSEVFIAGYSGPGGVVAIPRTDPNGNPVTGIFGDAFSGNSTITEIIIPDTVTFIEGIRECTALERLAIPDSVEEMGLWALVGDTALTELTIPGGVEVWEGNSDLFDNNGETGCGRPESLTRVTLSGSGTSLDVTRAFGPAYNLAEFAVSDSNTAYSAVDGVLFDKAGKKLISCPKALAGTYEVPTGVTGIGDKAFRFCEKLTKVVIPDSVTALGDNLFGACRGLTEVKLPNGITRIGTDMFYNCGSLTEFTVPDGVKSIGSYAFGECMNLTSVTIPESVTSIEEYAFDWFNEDLVIYGAAGSYAETYAAENRIPFTAI